MHRLMYGKFGIGVTLVASLAGIFSTSVSTAATPSVEELWGIIQQQQVTIDSLQERLAKTDKQVADTAEAVAETADVVDEVIQQTTAAPQVETGARPQSYGARFARGLRGGGRTVLGGYCEQAFNNLDDVNDTIGGDDSLERTDYHRFVLYLGHNFTDDLRFFSELEVEHSLTGSGAPGEVELEQAWLEYDVNNEHRIRAGLDILPIGLLNPTHEPNTFFGVERNRVETEIIPSTWWEAGIGANGGIGPAWNYDLVMHTGLR